MVRRQRGLWECPLNNPLAVAPLTGDVQKVLVHPSSEVGIEASLRTVNVLFVSENEPFIPRYARENGVRRLF